MASDAGHLDWWRKKSWAKGIGSRGEPVPVTGCWLRTVGKQIQILLEIDGHWRLVHDEPTSVPDPPIISCIIEPSGIRNSPVDHLESPDPANQGA